MTGKRCLARFHFVWVCLALAVAPVRGQEPGQRAALRVYLPADARLSIDGRETKQTGSLRRFYSPPLAPDKSYHYTLVCTYEKDGKPVKREEVVHIRAGDDKEVDLRDRTASSARKSDDRIGKREETNEAEREPDVVFVPTPQEVVDRMLELAAVKKDDVVYDLGCGDGRIVVTAAKRNGCKAKGFDIDPERVKESRANVKKNNVEKLVTIEQKDIFKLDLQPASVVTLYLLPELNVKLIPQLEKLKAGSRIVSHDFSMRGVKPKQTVTVNSKEDSRKHTIYLWETPLEKE
jgi:uncharacterized protein (TIGR03000 family)